VLSKTAIRTTVDKPSEVRQIQPHLRDRLQGAAYLLQLRDHGFRYGRILSQLSTSSIGNLHAKKIAQTRVKTKKGGLREMSPCSGSSTELPALYGDISCVFFFSFLLLLGSGSISMGVEEFFCFRRVDPLVLYMIQIGLFVFLVVFWFQYVVSGSVWRVFRALSMLLKATFIVVKRDLSLMVLGLYLP